MPIGNVNKCLYITCQLDFSIIMVFRILTDLTAIFILDSYSKNTCNNQFLNKPYIKQNTNDMKNVGFHLQF